MSKLPEVIDLFSGCGGLALGFQSAGFDITHGIELMPEALQTLSSNLHWRFGKDSKHICGDITQMTGEVFKKKIKKAGCIVIGGPPCQAYSSAGRAKLKSLGADRINTKDKRGYLFQDFLRFVFDLDARAVVMENVPEATNFGGRNIPQEVADILEANGYNVNWTVLTSSDFGVPQIRERVILVGVKKDEDIEFEFPWPTHYNQAEKKSKSSIRTRGFDNFKNYIVPKGYDKAKKKWVTVGDAFSDLPILFPDEHAKYNLWPIGSYLPYRCDPQNDYQRLMRDWYGTTRDSLNGHCFRKTLRDFPIFSRMKQGDNFVEASKIADEIFEEACRTRGITLELNPEAYKKLKQEIVPPYDRDSFLTKWQRLCLDKPSHTLVAHLSVDTYSHIHPVEPRGISVREAARLQSFPDDFSFDCSMGDAYKQIGNAVPPLMAKAIALQLKKAFRKTGK